MPAYPSDILDCRPAAAFLAGHLPGSAGIPLEQLPTRVHELPARGNAIRVADTDPARAAAAAALLVSRGLRAQVRPLDPRDCIQPGPSTARLWSPSLLLQQAVQCYADSQPAGQPRGPALDLACGTGRDAVYLAAEGFAVQAVDILPDALARAADLAARHQVSLQLRPLDLRRDWPFPAGAYSLVAMFRFLHRPLLPKLPTLLRLGGLLVIETFHQRCRDTRQGPRKESHLLRTGELAETFSELEFLHLQDGIEREGRFYSQLIARQVTK